MTADWRRGLTWPAAAVSLTTVAGSPNKRLLYKELLTAQFLSKCPYTILTEPRSLIIISYNTSSHLHGLPRSVISLLGIY